jgi:predicted transposase/invertase (TIGR01784 family)
MANKPSNPHDKFWRKMLAHPGVNKEFFAQHLPDHIKNNIDFNSIKPLPNSFVDDELQQQITDLLYSTTFNNKPGFIYLLIEHQSTPDKLMPFRLLKYMVAIMDSYLEKHKETELPIVYPMIFYTGYKPYNYSTDIFDLFGEHKNLALDIFLKPYPLINLLQIPEEQYKNFMLYGSLARITRHIYEDDLTIYIKNRYHDLQTIQLHMRVDS